MIKAAHEVETLAEIGIVLLLFTIGVEFSFANLLQIRKSVLVAGPIQVVITCLAGFALTVHFGKSIGESVFIGFLLSLSSTAIVLKILQGRAEVDSPQGRTSLGILPLLWENFKDLTYSSYVNAGQAMDGLTPLYIVS